MNENCEHCGREPENGQATHWLGCEALRAPEPPSVGDDCEHSECSNPKRPQGKGPRPKYCTEHSDPKNRK